MVGTDSDAQRYKVSPLYLYILYISIILQPVSSQCQRTVSDKEGLANGFEAHSEVDTFDALLDLLRRLPPTNVEQNVKTLCDLVPDLADDLLGNVDQPLKLCNDEESGKDFLGCDYNRDGESFR